MGLGDALGHIGKKAMIALREPSLGPVFGMKGGATGGGLAQVVPMDDINLHFTGDFNAVALANNLLAAAIDNHVHHGNALGIDVRRISWRRVMDMNDRALRDITVGLGGPANGYPRQDGFDIVVASEVMAILCLATSLRDLKERLGRIVVAETRDRRPVRACDLKVHGAMTVLLRDALAPNLVQTLEHTPALLHGGPFANIAHGCNSVIATRTALRLADYVVTEAGFGADLGAEKFIDIKCRASGLRPAGRGAGGHRARAQVPRRRRRWRTWRAEDLPALQRGLANLERHLHNLRDVFGLPCVVAVNHFARRHRGRACAGARAASARLGVAVITARHWAEGGRGAVDLAREVVRCASRRATLRFAYDDATPLWNKMLAVATRVYGAADVSAPAPVRAQIERLQASGYGHLPVCVAKTQYSFATDPTLRGAPSRPHRERARGAAGRGRRVRGHGLRRRDDDAGPAQGAVGRAHRLDDDGRIVGLS